MTGLLCRIVKLALFVLSASAHETKQAEAASVSPELPWFPAPTQSQVKFLVDQASAAEARRRHIECELHVNGCGEVKSQLKGATAAASKDKKEAEDAAQAHVDGERRMSALPTLLRAYASRANSAVIHATDEQKRAIEAYEWRASTESGLNKKIAEAEEALKRQRVVNEEEAAFDKEIVRAAAQATAAVRCQMMREQEELSLMSDLAPATAVKQTDNAAENRKHAYTACLEAEALQSKAEKVDMAASEAHTHAKTLLLAAGRKSNGV